MKKKLLFSVSRKDFERQTFTVGGHGGGGKDTSNSGVRLIHHPSGAVGVGKDNRSNMLNERDAFRRLIETKEFKNWHRIECARRMGQSIPETPEQIRERINHLIDEGLKDGSIEIETYEPTN